MIIIQSLTRVKCDHDLVIDKIKTQSSTGTCNTNYIILDNGRHEILEKKNLKQPWVIRKCTGKSKGTENTMVKRKKIVENTNNRPLNTTQKTKD